MKKILNVILPIALLAVVYGFIREMYFVQKVYQEEYVTRFNLFSGLLTLVFILLVLLIGYGYSKTDRVRILDGIFGILPAIILLVPVVCHFLMVAISSVGGWITNFLDWTTLSIGGTPISGVINDHWQAFALAGLALLALLVLTAQTAAASPTSPRPARRATLTLTPSPTPLASRPPSR